MAKKKMEEIPLDQIEHVAVIYGDGSAMNQTGEYGAGATGYIYRKSNIGEKTGDCPVKYLISDIGYLETDALNKYKFNPVTVDFYFEGVYGYDKSYGTNSRAEILAFVESVRYLLDQEKINLKEIIYKGDSSYVLDMINNMLELELDMWRRKYVSNKDLVDIVYDSIRSLQKRNILIKTIKVLGHSTSLGNNLADRLANFARRSKLHKFVLVEPQKHWSRKLELNPMYKFRQLFFINNHRMTDKTMYGIMDYGIKVEPGKKTHEAVFGLILPKEKDILIEDCIERYSEYYQSLSILNTIDLNQMFSRNNTYYYSLFGADIFYIDRKTNSLRGFDDYPVIKGVYPPGLGMQAYDKLESMYYTLEEYKEYLSGKDSLTTFLNITDQFYNVEGKKHYVCILKNDQTDVEMETEYEGYHFKLVISLAKDTLSRNQFKALEKQNPNVYLVLKRTGNDRLIEYQVIVDIYNGDLGIYTNIYSCKIFLNDVKNKKSK